MLDEATNRLFSQVGPGTPMGALLRRYGHPIAAVAELDDHPTKPVRLLGAGYTLRHNEHIRIDILTGHLPARTRAWIDLLGTVFFLLPMAVYIFWLSWPMVEDSYLRHEMSSDAGGLIRWPVKVLIPIGFFLLSLQGVSELIKRIAFLMGLIPDPTEKHEQPPEVQILRDEAPAP